MRLFAQTLVFEERRVVLPVSAPWLADYVRELTSFPGGKFDDQVDSTTQALECLRGRKLSMFDVV
jgi:predicted phage terminase large subunit-like protein